MPCQQKTSRGRRHRVSPLGQTRPPLSRPPPVLGRTAGNKHYLSDVLAGYAIGLGWGLLMEASDRRHTTWAVLCMSDGRTMVGLAFHWRFDSDGIHELLTAAGQCGFAHFALVSVVAILPCTSHCFL